MSRRMQAGVLLLVLFVTAVVVLRNDLLQWRLYRADRAFRMGDLRSAQAVWSSAAIAQSTRHKALLNRGIARYRLGELAAACADFRAVAASGDSNFRQHALYNLGTTLLVVERERQKAERQEREQWLGEAVRQLQAAVTLLPTDADAVHNLTVAQGRLAAVAGDSSAKRAGLEPSRQLQDKAGRASDSPKSPGTPGSGAGSPGADTNLDSTSGRRRAAPVLSAEQALRMLDEARGRETLRSGVAAGSRQEKLTPPEKDW